MFRFNDLQILPAQYLIVCAEQMPDDLAARLSKTSSVEFTSDTFGFYTSVAAVFSSRIEGAEIEVDSYLKHKFRQATYAPDYTKKIDDLFEAYAFARDNTLDFNNLLAAHAQITRHLLRPSGQGKIRTKPVMIIDRDGRIEYEAAEASMVKTEMEKLFADIALLLQETLDTREAFYFAAMIHLVFLKIHPFEDGNGRTARLLEKWFLAKKLGENAWFIPSERYYYEHLAEYYRNVHLGLEYKQIDYGKGIGLVNMLVDSVAK